MRQGLAATVLLTALAAVGCADDDGTPVERAEVNTTSAPATTTSSPTTTTTPPCPSVGGPPPGAPPVAGDLDGDGRGDVAWAQVEGADWRLGAELARGGGAVIELQTSGGHVGLVGTADVDRDGGEEIWARTGAGASTTIVGLFVLEGCELGWATLPTAQPAELPAGGTVGTTSGVECPPDGPHILTHTATYVGDGTGDRYSVTTVAYDLDGRELVERDRSTAEVGAQDEGFLRYASFRCGDLSL